MLFFRESDVGSDVRLPMQLSKGRFRTEKISPYASHRRLGAGGVVPAATVSGVWIEEFWAAFHALFRPCGRGAGCRWECVKRGGNNRRSLVECALK